MTSRSGLKSLTREFTGNSEVGLCEWLPTPDSSITSGKMTGSEPQRASFSDVKNTEGRFNRSKSSSALMTEEGRAARLAAIRAAMEETPDEAVTSKRPSPTEDIPGPAKKRRSDQYYEDEPCLPTPAATSSKPPPKTTSKKPAKIFLSAEQRHILSLVMKGNSVFYTGSAGTGKSVLLREIIQSMKSKYSRSMDAVAITASTGIAACNIGGMTIHSFSGIGLGNDSAEQLTTKVRKNKKALGRWQRTKVLIVDEVSMVDGDLFDKLARIACALRKTDKPFGGIQLVVTGDFFQLPPVTHNGDPTFAFEAEQWARCVPNSFKLTKVFRQSDQTFVDMLNEMRYGKLTPASIAKFKKLSRPLKFDDGIDATELFPRRENVDSSNQNRNMALQGSRHQYHASDGGTMQDVMQRDKLINNSMYPKVLELKVGSQVMLIKNTDETLVNGSLGKVIKFETTRSYAGGSTDDNKENAAKKKPKDERAYPIVRFETRTTNREIMVMPETWKSELPSGEVQASRTQLPLILSWAMSIHKSQGQTLERVKVDLGRVFEKGQAYVALSRATSMEGLQVLGFDERKVMVHPKVVEWSDTLEMILDK